MRTQDIEILLHLITRTEMYTMKDKAGYIISYIHGYEAGSNGKCNFSKLLSELLESEFKLKRRAMGWNGQLIEFGKENNLTWETSFKKIGLKVLSKYFQGESKNKFEDDECAHPAPTRYSPLPAWYWPHSHSHVPREKRPH